MPMSSLQRIHRSRGPAGRLPDYIRPGLPLLLVGINPGLRSAEVGHHFAGPSNRFWRLLHESGITPRRLSYEEDALLPEFGVGLTNIVSRPTRSSSGLGREDFLRGQRELARKISRFRPRAVGFVGLTVFREYRRHVPEGMPAEPLRCGLQPETIGGAAVFVLPNPSGRNAHYSLAAMLRHWRALARWLDGHRELSLPPART